MGCCFRACFGDSKRRKPRKSAIEIPSSNHILKATEAVHPLERAKEGVEVSININADSLEKLEEQIDLCHTTEITSDPVIEDDEAVPSEEVIDNLDEIKKEEKSGKEDDEPRGSSNLSAAFSLPLNHRYADCPNSDDEYLEELDHLDEEEEEEERKDGGDDGDVKNKLLIQEEESSESLFSLSIDSRKQFCTVEAGEKEVNSAAPSHCSPDIQPDKAVPDEKRACRNQNVDSVLNPVYCVLNPIENVSHSNAAKVKTTLPPVQHLEKESINSEKEYGVHHLDKENINSEKDCGVHHLEKEKINSEKDYDAPISPEPTFKRSLRRLKENYSNLKPAEEEIAVDTSLSNWLVESETTPKSKSSSTSSIGNSPMWTRNSAKSYEDRPILGALTLEELKQFSAFSTPRRSRSRSPEAPIIGTVGSYWNHTGQDADLSLGSSCRGSTKTARKSREDEKVNWNSTPFLERLDRALASNSAEV